MAVSEKYLQKVGFASIRRRNANQMVDEMLESLIEQCRADLMRIGVSKATVNDETDMDVLGCVESYVSWRFERNNDTAARMFSEYRVLAEQLRRSRAGGDGE